jgi:hypothetical protein
VLPVIAEERVHHQVGEVQDGPVDIEHDAELLVGVSPTHTLVVEGELPHPVRARPVNRLQRAVVI